MGLNNGFFKIANDTHAGFIVSDESVFNSFTSEFVINCLKGTVTNAKLRNKSKSAN